MNAIAKRESTTADGWDDTAAEAEARLIRGSLLKFADWKWSIGKEAIEVKEGRRLDRCRHRRRMGEMAGEQARRISPAGNRRHSPGS